jgi:hypothetical protein
MICFCARDISAVAAARRRQGGTCRLIFLHAARIWHHGKGSAPGRCARRERGAASVVMWAARGGAAGGSRKHPANSPFADLPSAAEVTVTPWSAPYGPAIRIHRRPGINAGRRVDRILLDHDGRWSHDDGPTHHDVALDERSLNDDRWRRLIFVRVNFPLIGRTFGIAVRERRRRKRYSAHGAQHCFTHVRFPCVGRPSARKRRNMRLAP